MFNRLTGWILAATILLGGVGSVQAQYLTRHVISLAEAKKMAAAAQVEAAKNNWKMVVAIVDIDGVLIYLERADDAYSGSPHVATEKARTAAMFRRSTKVLEDALNGTKDTPGRMAVLKIFQMPTQGGLPVKLGEEFVGGIGCSGGTAAQDEQSCAAGVAAASK